MPSAVFEYSCRICECIFSYEFDIEQCFHFCSRGPPALHVLDVSLVVSSEIQMRFLLVCLSLDAHMGSQSVFCVAGSKTNNAKTREMECATETLSRIQAAVF